VQAFARQFGQVVVFIFTTVVLVLSAQATTFSNASLQGSYGLLGNHWTADPNASQLGRVAVMTFDGVGDCTESYTEMVGGTFMAGTITGTYAINSNGTGTITAGELQLAIVLNSTVGKVAHGFQLLLTTDLGYNAEDTGIALLQSTAEADYSLATVKGTFSFEYNEWTADPTQTYYGGIGLFTFNGKGNVTGSSSYTAGGVLATNTFTGTYTVNTNGSGTISLSTGVQYAFVLNTVTGGLAKGLQFVQTNTTGNLAICGVAQKQ